jgi:hypothetical protein
LNMLLCQTRASARRSPGASSSTRQTKR